jgi:hypothetical protein
MEKAHRDTIRKNRVLLITSLEPLEIGRLLFKAEPFNTGHLEELESKETRTKGCRYLLDVIVTRGPTAYSLFIDALLTLGYIQEAQLLR